MTPAELLALADAATGGGSWGTYEETHHESEDDPKWTERYVTDSEGVLMNYMPGEWPESNVRLIALAPDLARLVAEMGEALERELNEETSTHVHVLAEKCVICERLRPLLAKLSELEPK